MPTSTVPFSARLTLIRPEYSTLTSTILVVPVRNFSGPIVCRMSPCRFARVRDNSNPYINDLLRVFSIHEKGEIIAFVWEWETPNKISTKIFLNSCICKTPIRIWFKIFHKVKKYFKWMKAFFLNQIHLICFYFPENMRAPSVSKTIKFVFVATRCRVKRRLRHEVQHNITNQLNSAFNI